MVKPSLPGGFKDYGPEEQLKRERMLGIIKRTFRVFGFLPMDTPAVERIDVLTAGDPNFDKQIFEVNQRGGDKKSDAALRFDLTVPLARFIAANPKIKKPFRRYQIGRVWRGERQQAGRYKEFLQCDADIVGAPSLIADAEIIALMVEVMDALGVKDFKVKLNSRKVLDLLPEEVGFKNGDLDAVLRTIDKLDKIGWSGAEKELIDLGLKKSQVGRVKEFLNSKPEKMKGVGMEELKKVQKYLGDLGVSGRYVEVDFSLARGLGYYTGTIFEVVLTKKPEIGSVFSGGRYDGLIERFTGGKVPAVGASLGFDRLFAAIGEEFSEKEEGESTKVLVLNFDKSAESDVLKIVQSLRGVGVSTEIYVGQEDNLKGQMAYASAQNFPYVVIIGPEEKSSDMVTIRDMKKRKQKEVKQKDVVKEIR